MFEVLIDTEVTLYGCPENGIDCIDWRRKHGLPDDTTSIVPIRIDCESEHIVREFADLSDDDADLISRKLGGHFGLPAANPSLANHVIDGKAVRHSVSLDAYIAYQNGNVLPILREMAIPARSQGPRRSWRMGSAPWVEGFDEMAKKFGINSEDESRAIKIVLDRIASGDFSSV